jgi:hypothetical protein
VPVNPEAALTVTGTFSVEQGGTLSVVGELTLNNGRTSTCTIVERAAGPPEASAGVPVMVMNGYVPDVNGAALGAALSVTVVVLAVAGLGLNDALTPVGRPVALKVTAPSEPLKRWILTASLAVEPWAR